MAGIPPIPPKAFFLFPSHNSRGHLCPLGPKVIPRHRMTLRYAPQFKSFLQILRTIMLSFFSIFFKNYNLLQENNLKKESL